MADNLLSLMKNIVYCTPTLYSNKSLTYITLGSILFDFYLFKIENILYYIIENRGNVVSSFMN